jgi:hypothetical protein
MGAAGFRRRMVGLHSLISQVAVSGQSGPRKAERRENPEVARLTHARQEERRCVKISICERTETFCCLSLETRSSA